IEDKQVPNRQTPVTPPGSISARNMQRHCTACQLCVSACKNNVLRPSTDPLHLMQPVMSFERGYCRPECTDCSQVCPTGAIRPVTVEDKTAIHVGHAVWIAENCVPVAKGDQCGACARHCPADAIQMVDYTTADGRTVQVPAIDNERCIGCGKCEYLCPARPLSAIYVEGNVTHHIS
ncbi:MAG: 4Fe-4S dicluster domain-containing protein, partial [Paludibacteraceae bacterium]|nr:4Fe-4S dicluster domain-containing protein [Paludibacteraceae bacterium]